MEARSLGTVNYLAANPPQYPVNPAEQRREAVTLYISRVPGTRDVILSPFKPQLKNVSPEDVASSLYYIHHDTSPTAFAQEEAPRSSNDSNRSRAIPRKPVPGATQQQTPSAAQVPTPVASPVTHPAVIPVTSQIKSPDAPPVPTPGTPEEPPPEYEPTPSPAYHEAQASNSKAPPPPSLEAPGPSIPVDVPSRGAGSDELFLSPSHPPPGHVHPHPLPAVPNEPPSVLTPPPIPAKIPLNQPQEVVEDDPPPPPLPPRRENLSLPSLQTGLPARKPINTSPPDAGPTIPAPQSAHEPFSSTERSYDVDYSPRPSTSHSLNNEAHLISPRLNQEGQPRLSLSQRPTTDPFTLILIRRDPSTGLQWNVAKVICQPRDLTPVTPMRDESDGTVAASSQSYPAIDIQIQNTGYAKFRHNFPRRSMEQNGDQAPRTQQADPSLFTRQVAMFYSKSWATNFREKLNQMEKKHNNRTRKLSNDSTGSTDSAEGPSTSIGVPIPGMKPRGYIFTSPWDTRCEFRTGDGGRSLRLIHILGDSVPPTFNGQEDGESHHPSSVVLSELRFNLPNTDLFHSTHDKNLANVQNQLGNLSKFFQKRTGHGQYEDDEDDDPASPFDLSLGRENAGGGSRGTRVKMGKLIIYHDGLKMLDLVVAANMGVWWKSWEKNF